MNTQIKKIWIISGLLFVLSQVFFLINIQFPRGHNFDEFHYVPSAKQFLELRENQNYEHPPLGKELIAVGIATFGDRPLGWRIMSTVFGSLTLVGMFLWGFALFRTQQAALSVAVITLFNQLLYVQARIGMLDTFMFAFIVWGLASFTAAWDDEIDPRHQRRLLYFSGAMMGLATATKWFGVIPWVFCVMMVLGVKLFQIWKVRLDSPSAEDWYSPTLFRGVGWMQGLWAWLLIPLFFYYLTFLPFLFVGHHGHSGYGVWEILIEMQRRMWDGQSRVVGTHPYLSHWVEWPIMRRPIWYAFDKEGAHQEFVRGVLLLGNPLVMWGGLAALLSCAWGWLVNRRRDAMFVFLTWLAFWLCWFFIPRKVAFYYYYYPAGMVLSLAWVYVLQAGQKAPYFRKQWPGQVFLAACLFVFFYFFPILAALQIPADEFRKWMWLSSWI